MAVIYNVSHLTSMSAVKGAQHSILCKEMEEESMEADNEWMDDNDVGKAVMGFTLKLQVPKTFKINTKEVDSMPWAIKNNFGRHTTLKLHYSMRRRCFA